MTEPADSTPIEPLDLSAILDAGGEPRRAVIDVATLNLTRFGIGELLELTDVIGVEPDKLGDALRGPRKARVVVALAWLIARRVEPALTLADVERWDIEVRGTPPARPTADHRRPRQPARRSS